MRCIPASLIPGGAGQGFGEPDILEPSMDAQQDPVNRELQYPDALLLDIYRRARTVALVGASPDWKRPSYFVMKYLQVKGYRVIPVNPMAVGRDILGEAVVADLADISVPVDVVDIFRKPEAVPAIVEAAIAIGAKVVWMQLGIRNDAAAARAQAAGLRVVMDRCMKIEYGRLAGELSWSGINSGIISSRRRRLLA